MDVNSPDALLHMFLTISIVTYGLVATAILCTVPSHDRTEDRAEIVGNTEKVLYSDPLDEDASPSVEAKERLLSKVDIPIIQEELEELKKTYTFGIERWNGGPFLEFTDLTFTNGKLYCIRNNTKRSVAKCVEEAKHKTRPRWIHHLCFLQDGKVVLFRDYLWEKHGLTFS